MGFWKLHAKIEGPGLVLDRIYANGMCQIETLPEQCFADTLSSNVVHDLQVDPHGNLWVATENALTLLKNTSQEATIQHFDSNDGLLGSAVFSLAFANNHLYVGMDGGLACP